MSPFEFLYGQKCRTPVSWDNLADMIVLGPDILKDMEQIVKEVQQNLKVGQDRRKSYPDLKRTPREFNIGDHSYLKVKSKKISLSLGICSKLEPRYCGPFKVLAKIGILAYHLALPLNIKVHDVFHVSLLKKYIHDATHIIE